MVTLPEYFPHETLVHTSVFFSHFFVNNVSGKHRVKSLVDVSVHATILISLSKLDVEDEASKH